MQSATSLPSEQVPTSPLQRHPEQPPCDAKCEALCLNGMVAVPERVRQYDLGPHLLFPEHRAIWRSMVRAADGEASGFWWRLYGDLRREQDAHAVCLLLGVLNFVPYMAVDDSLGGRALFALALAKIRRCSEARRRIHAVQEEVTELWRADVTPYTAAERRRLFGPECIRIDV